MALTEAHMGAWVTRYHLLQSFFLRLEDEITLVASPLSYKKTERSSCSALKLMLLCLKNPLGG